MRIVLFLSCLTLWTLFWLKIGIIEGQRRGVAVSRLVFEKLLNERLAEIAKKELYGK